MSTLKTNAIQTVAGKPILNSTGSILQMVQTIKTDTFAGSTNSWMDVTGLNASITPSSTSNIILIMVTLGAVGNGNGGTPHTTSFRILRNSATVDSLYGNAEGSRPRGNFRTSTGYNADHCHSYSYQVIDSPSSTSLLTYQLQMWVQTGTAYINRERTGSDSNDTYRSRTSSNIILMEISA